jgi:hypothetical protein
MDPGSQRQLVEVLHEDATRAGIRKQNKAKHKTKLKKKKKQAVSLTTSDISGYLFSSKTPPRSLMN